MIVAKYMYVTLMLNFSMLTVVIKFFLALIERCSLFQLEERIDTLCKESRAHKSNAEASNLLISELREELQQVRKSESHVPSA